MNISAPDGNFEHHSQFFGSIADESLKEALKEHFEDMTVDEENQNKTHLEKMLRQFLTSNNIVLFWGEDSSQPFDDLHQYHSRLVAAHLMSKVQKLFAKAGDGQGLQAVNRVLTPYFLNHGGHKSKYAKYTLKDNVCHDSSSDWQQNRNDLTTTVNAWGGGAHSVESDQFQEHRVKNIKCFLDNLHGNIDPANIEKVIRSADLELKISAQMDHSMNVSYKSPASSVKFLTDEEVLKVRKMMAQLKPFSRERDVVHFVEPIHGVNNYWRVDSEDSLVKDFLARNKKQYLTWGPFV